jgi:hypothetical protein
LKKGVAVSVLYIITAHRRKWDMQIVAVRLLARPAAHTGFDLGQAPVRRMIGG